MAQWTGRAVPTCLNFTTTSLISTPASRFLFAMSCAVLPRELRFSNPLHGWIDRPARPLAAFRTTRTKGRRWCDGNLPSGLAPEATKFGDESNPPTGRGSRQISMDTHASPSRPWRLVGGRVRMVVTLSVTENKDGNPQEQGWQPLCRIHNATSCHICGRPTATHGPSTQLCGVDRWRRHGNDLSNCGTWANGVRCSHPCSPRRHAQSVADLP